MSYTVNDLPFLLEELARHKKLADDCDLENYHKDRYSNSYRREVKRLTKLIALIQQPVNVEPYGQGCVLLDNKFIVSLISNKWRVAGKGKWYFHKNIPHFITTYVLKDEPNETNT